MNKQHVTLREADRQYLNNLTSKGEQPVKVYKRALALLELDRGKTYTSVAQTVGVTKPVVSTWAKNYRTIGLRCLEDKPRSGRPIELDGTVRAKITALACSEAPEGYGQWSLRLLAEKAVELDYCDHLSHTEVATILKKTNYSRTRSAVGGLVNSIAVSWHAWSKFWPCMPCLMTRFIRCCALMNGLVF
jgi:transposase